MWLYHLEVKREEPNCLPYKREEPNCNEGKTISISWWTEWIVLAPFIAFFGGFGGVVGAITPPFGLGAGVGGFGARFRGSFGSGFGPLAGNGGTSSSWAGTGTGSWSEFGSCINEGFEDNCGNNPNDKIEGELDEGDLGEGGLVVLVWMIFIRVNRSMNWEVYDFSIIERKVSKCVQWCNLKKREEIHFFKNLFMLYLTLEFFLTPYSVG